MQRRIDRAGLRHVRQCVHNTHVSIVEPEADGPGVTSEPDGSTEDEDRQQLYARALRRKASSSRAALRSQSSTDDDTRFCTAARCGTFDEPFM